MWKTVPPKPCCLADSRSGPQPSLVVGGGGKVYQTTFSAETTALPTCEQETDRRGTDDVPRRGERMSLRAVQYGGNLGLLKAGKGEGGAEDRAGNSKRRG